MVSVKFKSLDVFAEFTENLSTNFTMDYKSLM